MLIDSVTIPAYRCVNITVDGELFQDRFACPGSVACGETISVQPLHGIRTIQNVHFTFEHAPKMDIAPEKIRFHQCNRLLDAVFNASSVCDENSEPQQILDPDSAAIWCAGSGRGAGEWWQADFPDTRTINCVHLQQRWDSDRVSGYKIQYKTKDSGWIDAAVHEGSFMGCEPVCHRFETVQADAVRILITAVIPDRVWSEPGLFDVAAYGLAD
jgi:hypothetical protein